jgi:hypothetical protein
MDDYPHWNRVYLAVIAFAVVTIVLLAIFSEMFTPSGLN